MKNEKTEIIGVKFKKTKIIEIHALGNKIFEIPFDENDFKDERAYIFAEAIPKQAQMLLNMFMGKK